MSLTRPGMLAQRFRGSLGVMTIDPSTRHAAPLGAAELRNVMFVTEAEAARLLNLSRSYLRQLRVKGGGCRFSRFGRAIRYRLSELESWAAARAVSSTSE